MQTTGPFIERITQYIIDPIITLLLGTAVVVFMWGVFQYFFYEDGSQARTDGAKHILWGVIGLLIMGSYLGIVAFIKNSLKDLPQDSTFRPK